MCRFCNPDKIDWEEEGFFGYSYPCCSKTAFIIKKVHADIREDEYKLINKLIEKHYPNLKLNNISLYKQLRPHWYIMLKESI